MKNRQIPERIRSKKRTEAMLTAAQDQALNTKYGRTQIFGINEDSKFCSSKESNETAFRILKMCSKLTTTNYFKSHNNVAANSSQEYMSALWY